MLNQMLVGGLLIVGTVIIHAVSLEWTLKAVLAINLEIQTRWRSTVFSFTILAVFLAHIIEIWLWALVYHFIEEIPDFETALYFSTSCFTTVGFGDITLSADWRLLSSFEAVNGMILFGWSTAFIFDVVKRTYQNIDVKI